MALKFGGFLRGMFGGGDAPAAEVPASEYNGFTIRPAPKKQGAVWLVAGTIAKEFPDGVREHHFIRADTFPGRDEAVAFSLRKAHQIIDERGDKLFAS
jgi:hypothetical protein